MELRTVEWKDDSVVMIDQTKLPNELVLSNILISMMLRMPLEL